MRIKTVRFFAIISGLLLFAACDSGKKAQIEDTAGNEEGRTAIVTQSLPTTSAIKMAWEKQKQIDEEKRVQARQREKELARRDAAQELGKTFGLSYTHSSGDSFMFPFPPDNLLIGRYVYLDGLPTSTARAVENAFPKCVSDRRGFNTECVYASFILERLAKNKDLAEAFTTAKQANVKIVLDFVPSFFAVEPGRITINITGDDAAIINFLLKDSKIETKK